MTVIIIISISIILHAWSVWQLPLDFDEPIYLQAGNDYADFIKNGDIQTVVAYDQNREHPALVKILYSIPKILFPDQAYSFYLFAGRTISAIFGVLAVFITTLINPWAGFLLSLHSMTLKYTSQAYLEAVPLFAMMMSLYAMLRGKDNGRSWFYIAAVFLGITAAGKYPYLIIIPVLFTIWLGYPKKDGMSVFLFILISLLTFFALNPSLWNNPLNGLIDSIKFHINYSQSTDVQTAHYPWYQPLIFLSTSTQWHPQVFFFFTSDELIFYLSLFGFWFEFKEKKWSLVWLISGLLVLLAWQTKWPQYTLILSPLLALVAGFTIDRIWKWLKPREDYWNYLEEMLPHPPRILWWVIISILVVLYVGKIGYEVHKARAKIGWSQYSTLNSSLKSDTINQISGGGEREILIGTNYGFQIWNLDEEGNVDEVSLQFDQSNSPIPGNRVIAIAYEKRTGISWIGTDHGLASFSRHQWDVYSLTDKRGEDFVVFDIDIDEEGGVWAGTNEGLLKVEDGQLGRLLEFSDKYPEAIIYTLIRRKTSQSDQLWAGTSQGLILVDFLSQSQRNLSEENDFVKSIPVTDLEEMQNGKILAVFSNGMIGFYENGWQFLNINPLRKRSNTINAIVEAKDGSLWVGFGYSTQPGGYLMSLDTNGRWKGHYMDNSGFLESEPLDLYFDPFGNLWVATNGGGIQTFSIR